MVCSKRSRDGRGDARARWRRAFASCAIFVLAACGPLAHQSPGALDVRSAQIVVQDGGARLELALDCKLSGPMQDALDHGIPLPLVVDVRGAGGASAQSRIELRYFPLSRRYQLAVNGRDDERGFATRGYLLAALGSLRLGMPDAFAHLPAGAPLRVSAALDPSALPGALRLPALFEPAWRLSSTETTWSPATP